MLSKKNIKDFFQKIGLLNVIQYLNYKASFYNSASQHPRKKVFMFYRQFIPKGSFVFDIGANIGERVAVFNELGAKILAVEPQVHCVEKIRSSFGKNKNVIIENAGAGEQNGEMDFFICEEDDRLSTFSIDQIQNSFFSGGTKWTKKEVIKIFTLDSLIEKYGLPGFCKIDVEGYELNVLKGLNKTIPSLSFEFSSKQIDKALACMKRLKEINPAYSFNVCFGEPYSLYLEKWAGMDEVISVIESEDKKSPTHAWGDIYAKAQ